MVNVNIRVIKKSAGVTAVLLAVALFVSSTVLFAGEDKCCDSKDKKAECKVVQLAKISISGALSDNLPPDNPFGPQTVHFRALLETIKKAAEDDEVAGIFLNVNSPAIGFAKVREVRDALGEFKESGKKIFSYTEGAGLKDMTILSMCDFLAIPESGGVIMPGFNLEVMYYKDFFEKIGFRMMVEHIGDFKSAYENMHLEGMSDANRTVLNILLDEFYNTSIEMIAEGRGIPVENVALGVDRAILSVREAHGLGLLDAIMYRDQFDAYLKKELKADKIKILGKYGRDSVDLDTTNPLALFSQIMKSLHGSKKPKSKNPKVAVIYGTGPISSGKNSVDFLSGGATMGSVTMVKAINDAAKDDTVKAIVLRVDSPGGSGLASDMIWRAECEAKKKKPLIVSMGDVAGSGGYYISMAADVIIAEPGTITGSIGVVSAIPNVHGCLEKLGIRVERISRGRNASLNSIMAPPEDVNLSILTDYMESFYWDFVDKVAAGRTASGTALTREQVHEIAQGRVWTGRQALDNGLIDAVGSLADAIEVARVKAGLTDEDNWEIVESPEPPDFFSSLTGGDDEEARAMLAHILGQGTSTAVLFEAFPELRRVLANFFSFVRVAKEETYMYMMPVEFMVN